MKIEALFNCGAFSLTNIKAMQDGAILSNSGHIDVEIDVKGLEKTKTSGIER